MNSQLDTAAARRLVESTREVLPDLIREVITVSEIPAPTFQEVRRSEYLHRRMVEIGLSSVETDQLGNVVGRINGTPEGPTILFAAHIDTVFPLDTNVTVQTDGDILRGPGVGDNSASVAVMLFMAKLLIDSGITVAGNLLIAATVGEEGLGDLRGMRQLLERCQDQVDYVIALDGSMGSLVRQAVGSRRFRLTITGEGGHSWGAFGAPSAIHSLGRIVAQISEIRVPTNPKTTFNVGTISGGTSVNTIAASAEAVLDLRSTDPVELRRLEEQVRRIVTDGVRQYGLRAELDLIGDRPVGSIPDDHDLCRLVRKVHQQIGIQTRSYPSSTDANIPLVMCTLLSRALLGLAFFSGQKFLPVSLCNVEGNCLLCLPGNTGRVRTDVRNQTGMPGLA